MEQVGLLGDVLSDLAEGDVTGARTRCAGDGAVASALHAIADFWDGDFQAATAHARAALERARAEPVRALALSA
ncbi:MAG: hypothetical protein QM572_15630, partial [Nocardioides sp.]|uniref:hypothetical protein n=1 Tax=Nocardioides sp. TaxID=35761 RepID=UPI0039E5910A